MIKQGSPVLTRGGFGEALHLESDVAGSRNWWVRLNDGIERWYAEKNLTLLVPETSLAKLKAQWQAEALDKAAEFADRVDGGPSQAGREIAAEAERLRRLAGGDV